MTSNDVAFVASVSLLACTAGAVGSYILTKKHTAALYESLIEEEVKKAHDFYSHRAQIENAEEHIPVTDTVVEEVVEEITTSDAPDDLQEDRVNYNKIVSQYGSENLPRGKKLSPRDGESMEDFEIRISQEARSVVSDILNRTEPDLAEEYEPTMEEDALLHKNIFEDHGQSDEDTLDRSTRSADKPFIISHEEFEDGDLEYSQNTLTYYQGDGVLTDEDDKPILDMTVVIESNLQFGNASGDKNVVYIRNDKLEVDFEVVQDLGYYTEEVLGVPRQEERKGLR